MKYFLRVLYIFCVVNFSASSYLCLKSLDLGYIPSDVSNMTIILNENVAVRVEATSKGEGLSFIATNKKWKDLDNGIVQKWSMRLDDSKEEKADIIISSNKYFNEKRIDRYDIQFLNNSNLSHYEYSKRLPKLKFMSDGRVFELNFKTKYNSFFFESLYMKYINYFEFGRINPKAVSGKCGFRAQLLINYN